MCFINADTSYDGKCSLTSYFGKIEARAEAFLVEIAEGFGAKVVTCSRYTRRAEADPAWVEASVVETRQTPQIAADKANRPLRNVDRSI